MQASSRIPPRLAALVSKAAVVAALAVAVLALGAGIVRAQGAVELGAARFQPPPGWIVTYEQADVEVDYASADGRFVLWVRWWFPSEPLLGYDDVVRHETRTVAGQDALFIHSETGAERFLQLAFPRKNRRGEQLLFQVIADPSVPFAEHEAMLTALLAGLTIGGVPAVVPDAEVPTVASDTGRVVPDGTAEAPTPARRVPGLVFDGRSLEGLLPLGFDGGDFVAHVRVGADGLEIAMPEGAGWALAGIGAPDALVGLPLGTDSHAARITAVVDADRTTGLTLALTEPAQVGEDPEKNSVLDVRLANLEDGRGLMTVRVRETGEKRESHFFWPEGEAVFHVLLRPDRIVDLRSGDGSQLAEARLAGSLGGRTLALQAVVSANGRNRAASLVLERLSFDTVPHEPAPPVGALATDGRPLVLFDGYGPAGLWEPLTRHPAEYWRFANLSDGIFRIGWTAEEKGSWNGMITREPVLWLDRFERDAEIRIDLAIDGAATRGVDFSLTERYVSYGNQTGAGAYVLLLRRQADGTFSVSSGLRGQEEDALVATGLAGLPDRITLVLTPAGMRLEGEGMPGGVLRLPGAKPGVGLRIVVQAVPAADGSGGLALRGIRTSVRPASASPASAPADGVAPLPERVLFAGRPQTGWRPVSSGRAVFEELADETQAGFLMARRDPVPDWNRIALVEEDVAVVLDERIARTPFAFTLLLAPTSGLGMRLALHDDPDRVEDAAKALVSLRALPDGPEAGGLEIRMKTGHFSYDHWRRVLPDGTWQSTFDGRVRLLLGDGWVALALGDEIVMRGATSRIGRGTTAMLAVMPGGMANTDGGRLALREIGAGWSTPREMSALERLRLVDDDAFDPNAFLDILARDTGVAR